MKLKMEDNRKITKIVIGKEDELTDIVTGILDSQNERILVTFAEESDLLISPINLKVILETADERDKSIIAQIIKNPTGIRNAQLAGLTTIDNPSYPTEEMKTYFPSGTILLLSFQRTLESRIENIKVKK